MRLLAFCEAQSDFRLASGLIDRLLREQGPAWVVDNIAVPEVVRTWRPDGLGRDYFDLHKLNDYEDLLVKQKLASRRSLQTRGHFQGGPGGAGSAMARKAFLIARALHKAVESIDAVVLLWDADHQGDERADSTIAARDDARCWSPFQIICGVADPAREAWVLAGFDPCDDAEHKLLAELCSELTFSPVLDAVRLRDKKPGTLRDIKRVLRVLTAGDRNREERCWLDAPLAALRSRGGDSGLRAFLDEIEAFLVPLLEPAGHRRH